MKALIFGSSGQDGFYLKKILIKEGIEVVGVSRSGGNFIADIKDYNSVYNLVNNYKPDYIFNFAAVSNTDHKYIFENHETISTGTINLLEAVKNTSPNSKIFISGSALQFRNNGLPIDEEIPFDSKDAYSISRIHSVYACRYFRAKFGLKIYIGYLFNHDSCLRSENHLNQKIVRFVQNIKSDNVSKLKIGNVDIKKEFGFALDITKAIWLLVNQDKYFECVIGTGEAYSIKNWLEICFESRGEKWENYIETDENFVTDYDILVSNPSKIISLGWHPGYDIYRLANLMLNDLIE